MSRRAFVHLGHQVKVFRERLWKWNSFRWFSRSLWECEQSFKDAFLKWYWRCIQVGQSWLVTSLYVSCVLWCHLSVCQITPWTVQSCRASARLQAPLWAPCRHGNSTSWAHWGKNLTVNLSHFMTHYRFHSLLTVLEVDRILYTTNLSKRDYMLPK